MKKEYRKAYARLKKYADYLVEQGWQYAGGEHKIYHTVLYKERLVKDTFNFIAIKAIGFVIGCAIAVDSKHAHEEAIINFRHFKKFVKEWGAK